MFHRESIFSEPMGHEINLVIVTSIENKFELENIRVYCIACSQSNYCFVKVYRGTQTQLLWKTAPTLHSDIPPGRIFAKVYGGTQT